ncbi:phosphatidylinositol-specific phospholipase C [Pontiella sp.]|uniref:phosphatidylinositol-specific phospholipase C n=1 Tax=Pontiella sp. TaxID=2837462 RepID=UPI003566C6FB
MAKAGFVLVGRMFLGLRYSIDLRAATRCWVAGLCAVALGAGADGTNWMGSVDGAVALSLLSIPGTHNSAALHEPFPGTAKCQLLSLSAQLDAGVRFLDMRCRHMNDAFALYHGSVDQHQRFDEALSTVYAFLENNPTECVVMGVTGVRGGSNTTRTFEETFDAYVAKNPDKWRLSATIPTLGEARGKIVLLRRFCATALPKGLAATGWRNNTTFSTGRLRVQDCYRVSDNDAKWGRVANLFEESSKAGPDTLFINYTSGTRSGWFGIPSVTAVSDEINRRLETGLPADFPGWHGVVVMDFANATRTALVYENNARSARPHPQAPPTLDPL